MAKKLAPLVIPAVIDTSGIDKGVNSIRNKLSRVRGQGAGGGGIGGGGGGFSSGVTPYGLSLGGGSTVGSAMASAFGAAAGARAASNTNISINALKRNAATRRRKTFGVVSAIAATSKMSEGYEVTGVAQDINDIANLRDAREAIARSKARPSFGERFQNIKGNIPMYFGNIRKSNFGVGSGKRGSGVLGGAFGGVGSILGALAGGSVILGAIKQFGTRNMQERFSDLSQFTGNAANYVAAANIKRDTYNMPPTSAQGFYLGLRQGTGGRQTTIETLLREIGDVPSAITQQGGKFAGYLDTAARMGMGANLGTKSQQEAAGINAAMLTAEAVSAGGFGGPQVGNSIYNFMKRLFY